MVGQAQSAQVLHNGFAARLPELIEGLHWIKRGEFGGKFLKERRHKEVVNDDVAERFVLLESPAKFPGLIDHVRMD